MKNQKLFQDRFSDYLSKKVDSSKKQSLFGTQFSQQANSNQSSNTLMINSNSHGCHNINLSPYLVSTPHSNKSNYSFDSSAFSWSQFQSSKNKAQNNSKTIQVSSRKRLKKLRELQENQCAICLDQITNRCHLKCKHKFCLQCLQQWLKNSNKCPYCRDDINSYWFKGEQFEVEAKQFEYEGEEQDNLDWVCYLCDETQDGDVVLICDRCEAYACHIECDSTLNGRQPAGDWYCHFCR